MSKYIGEMMYTDLKGNTQWVKCTPECRTIRECDNYVIIRRPHMRDDVRSRTGYRTVEVSTEETLCEEADPSDLPTDE